LTIFRDDEVFGFKIRNVFAFFVLDDDVDVDEVGFYFDDFIVLSVRNQWNGQDQKQAKDLDGFFHGSVPSYTKCVSDSIYIVKPGRYQSDLKYAFVIETY
jgi:hypothetical protein